MPRPVSGPRGRSCSLPRPRRRFRFLPRPVPRSWRQAVATLRLLPTQGQATCSGCPHCGHRRTQRYGSFRLQNGTRKPRYRCCDCGRTFNPDTGTPLAYLKKRDRWPRQAECLVRGLPVRRAAAVLGVRVATAFAWRHRLLAPVAQRPQPVMTGTVAAAAAFIRYSEKGSRETRGPGSRGYRPEAHRRAFRRFIDGKPSCVLLVCAGEQQAAVMAGRGRPAPAELQLGLAPLLGAGAELYAAGGLLPFAEACRSLGLPHHDGRGPDRPQPLRQADRLCARLYTWLRRFRGVATRYLDHYLAWYLAVERLCRLGVAAAARRLLAETGARPLPGVAAGAGGC